MTLIRNVLPRLLDDLQDLTPPEDLPVLDELGRRLSERVLRVLVAGAVKRGKSTLLHELLGRAGLPTGVVPLTAVATTVGSGPVAQVVARFADGAARTLPLSGIAGLKPVDTPGVDSVPEHNTVEAEAALRTMDAAIFVLTADPPTSASEWAFLWHVRAQALRLFCVLDKVDRLDSDAPEEAVAFTRAVLAAELDAETTVFPLSARGEQVPGGEPGFRALDTRLTERLTAHITAVRDVATDLRAGDGPALRRGRRADHRGHLRRRRPAHPPAAAGRRGAALLRQNAGAGGPDRLRGRGRPACCRSRPERRP